ncbi:MAG: LysR family transcriptional regulator, partial [Pusillimonas sp.]|nr:LysR family transcriptional regulator [Pusillimonas sp.]
GHHLLHWLDQAGLPHPTQIVQCTSPSLMMEMMRRTDLVGFGPDRLMTDPLYSCGVVTFEVEPKPPTATMGLFRVRGVPLTPVAQKLEAWIKRAISNDNRAAMKPE